MVEDGFKKVWETMLRTFSDIAHFQIMESNYALLQEIPAGEKWEAHQTREHVLLFVSKKDMDLNCKLRTLLLQSLNPRFNK